MPGVQPNPTTFWPGEFEQIIQLLYALFPVKEKEWEYPTMSGEEVPKPCSLS